MTADNPTAEQQRSALSPIGPDGTAPTDSTGAGLAGGAQRGQGFIIGSFDLHRPRLITTDLARHAELLRLLGRLEFMSTRQITRMVYSDVSSSTVYRYLDRLEEEEIIYRTHVRYGVMRYQNGKASPMKHPYVYGLTPEGRELLGTMGAEPDEATLNSLKVRDLKTKRLRGSTLTHDLQVSWWCSTIIQELRRNRFCSRVFVQVEFVSHETQRIDALVIARFSTKHPREVGSQIPWFDGTPRLADEGEIRLALEVDRGTEPLKVLMEKGRAYRNLTADGTYYRRLGGAVVPVFLVPTRSRARQIAAEWRHVWPDGWGVITTPPSADHPEHGALWGSYFRLTNLNQTTPLMSEVVGGQDNKPEIRTLFTLEQWQKGIVAPDAPAPAKKRAPKA